MNQKKPENKDNTRPDQNEAENQNTESLSFLQSFRLAGIHLSMAEDWWLK